MNQKMQKGFTIIEILVSVTILTVGLLGILAMHLRSYSTVREAERVGLVSGLTESLAEAMRTNPKLSQSTTNQDEQGNPVIDLDWSDYTSSVTCSSTLSKPTTANTGNTSSTLAKYHLCSFEKQFKETVAEKFKYEICKAEANNGKCASTGNDYIIKVTWPVDDSGEPVSEHYEHFVVVNFERKK